MGKKIETARKTNEIITNREIKKLLKEQKKLKKE